MIKNKICKIGLPLKRDELKIINGASSGGNCAALAVACAFSPLDWALFSVCGVFGTCQKKGYCNDGKPGATCTL